MRNKMIQHCIMRLLRLTSITIITCSNTTLRITGTLWRQTDLSAQLSELFYG